MLQVWTVKDGHVRRGADVVNVQIAAAGKSISAVVIGEEGRGRYRAVIPVQGGYTVPCPRRGECDDTRIKRCRKCGTPSVTGDLVTRQDGSQYQRRVHPDSGTLPLPIELAEVGTTRSGRSKLLTGTGKRADTDRCLLVLETGIGFRGGNTHTGPRSGWECVGLGEHAGTGSTPAQCPECDRGVRDTYAALPGKVLARGVIAQGDAGRMGGGEQLLLELPKGAVLRVRRTGRLYGSPGEHLVVFDGERVTACTPEEADLLEEAY